MLVEPPDEETRLRHSVDDLAEGVSAQAAFGEARSYLRGINPGVDHFPLHNRGGKIIQGGRLEAQSVRHLLEWMEIAADHPPAGLQQRLHPPHKTRQIVKIMEAPP